MLYNRTSCSDKWIDKSFTSLQICLTWSAIKSHTPHIVSEFKYVLFFWKLVNCKYFKAIMRSLCELLQGGSGVISSQMYLALLPPKQMLMVGAQKHCVK